MPQPQPPKYCLTRDLPGERSRPGSSPRGAWHGRDLPDDLKAPDKWRESEAWLFSVDLWNGGFVWESWEVWEGLWRMARAGNPIQAKFLQGLVMLAGSRVHHDRGGAESEESLFRTGVLQLRSVRQEAGPEFMGVELDAFVAALESGRDRADIHLGLTTG